MIVKIPVTRAGIPAIEEATYRGISINATVCFTLPQCIAVAEAVERGLKRREREGKSIAAMGPVCTIMVGRLDDWLKGSGGEREYCHRSRISGVGRESRYSRRLTKCSASAATAFGCYQRRFAITCIGASSSAAMWSSRRRTPGKSVLMPATLRSARELTIQLIRKLRRSFRESSRDFRRAYNEDGLSPNEFDSFGPTVRTLRQFIVACHDLDAVVRDFLLPNPDTA